jgi:hypothetical protein
MRTETTYVEILGMRVKQITGYLTGNLPPRCGGVLFDNPDTGRRSIIPGLPSEEQTDTTIKEILDDGLRQAAEDPREFGPFPVIIKLFDVNGALCFTAARSLPLDLQPEHLLLICPWDMIA